MFLNGLLLIIAIVIFALLTVLCIVFAIVYFANSKRGKFGWLGGFFFCLAGLIVSVFYTVNTAVNKVKDFASDMEESFVRGMDSSGYEGYNFADSLKSEQIKYLKLLEPKENNGTVPDQFYNYLGFRDYYRLPLKYPFSLHCTDVLGNASLFNESDVVKFDQNDNGEKECNLNNISEFAFNNNILIVKQSMEKDFKSIEKYVIYHFSTGKTEEFNTLEELIPRAKNLGYSRKIKLFNCNDYYKLF